MWGMEGQMDPIGVLNHNQQQQQQQQQQDHVVQGSIPISYDDTHHHHHQHHLHPLPLSHESVPPQSAGLTHHHHPMLGGGALMTPHPTSSDLRHPSSLQVVSFSTPPLPPPHITTNSPFSVDFLLRQRGTEGGGAHEGASVFPTTAPTAPQTTSPSLPPSLSHHHDPDPSLVGFGLSQDVPGTTPFIKYATCSGQDDVAFIPDMGKHVSPYHSLHIAMETCPPDVASDDDGSRLAPELPPERPFSPPGLVLGKGEEEEGGRREEEEEECSPKLEHSSVPLQHCDEQLIGGASVLKVQTKGSQTGSQANITNTYCVSLEKSVAPPTSDHSHHSGPQTSTVQPLKHLDVPVVVTTGTPDNNMDDDDDVFLPDSPQGTKLKNRGALSISGGEGGPTSHRRGRSARNADLVKLQLPLSNG